MPGAELDLLKVVLKGNASHVMVWQHELSCIVEQLGKKNIPYLVLNGVTLGSSACRQFCVNNPSLLDIFVPPIDVPKAIGLLAKLGYQIPVQLNSWQWESLIAFGDRITVNPGSKSFSIQLRWRLAPPRFEWNSWNTLYDRARTVAIEGNIYSTLSLEDSLLFCCAQGAASVWNRLSAIGDLCELLYESDNLDWEYIQSQTSGRYHEFVVLTGVLLAHRIMGAALPCIVNEETRITQGVRTSCVEINKALFRNNKPENPTGFQKIHHLWCLCPDRSSKAEVIRSFLKPALEGCPVRTDSICAERFLLSYPRMPPCISRLERVVELRIVLSRGGCIVNAMFPAARNEMNLRCLDLCFDVESLLESQFFARLSG